MGDEVALIPSKKLRNKIAGFTTHMMKRISRGPVKGISLKLQEEGVRSVSTTFRISLLWTSRSEGHRDRFRHQEHASCYRHGQPPRPQRCLAQGAQAIRRQATTHRPSPPSRLGTLLNLWVHAPLSVAQ